MKEHIHVPAIQDDHIHQPRWDEPSRDAEGRGVADIENPPVSFGMKGPDPWHE